jgi:hypothetical protein
MRKVSLLLLLLILLQGKTQDWHPAGNNIKTEWAEKVTPVNPLPEYPRPQMMQENWQSINGLWEYAILPKGSSFLAANTGKILVPLYTQSSLSGYKNTGRVG